MLREVCTKYNSDKRIYGYCEIYEEALKGVDVKRLLEIGVKDGASLKMWKEFFPFAEIIGVDINEIDVPGCTVHILDQGKEIQNLPYANYDVIIDDGSHLQHDIMYSLENLYPLLNPGGLYFIEDVVTIDELNKGNLWGCEEKDFSDSVIKIFEDEDIGSEIGADVKIYYAKQKPLTPQATSNFIVIRKLS